MSNMIKGKQLDVNHISFRPAATNKNGKGKNAGILYRGNPLIVQSPLMLTWGLNERVPDDGAGRTTYDLALQFNDDNPSIRQFKENLAELQNKILEAAATSKSSEWFGKSKGNPEVLKELMYPILKYPKKKDAAGNYLDEPDYSRNPTMKLKVSYWDDKFNVELYDQTKSLIYKPVNEGEQGPQGDLTPMQLLPKGSHIIGVIRCNGIWFAGGRFGVTWGLQQARVKPPFRLVGSGIMQIQDDSDDEEALDTIAQKDKEKEQDEIATEVAAEVDANVGVMDSSDEEDAVEAEAEEEEQVVVVAPPKKKKKAVKKKLKRKKKVTAGAE